MLNFFKKKQNAASIIETDEVLQNEKMYQEGVSRLTDLIAPAAVKITPPVMVTARPPTAGSFTVSW